MSELVLGPLLRYVDHDSATIWVETADTDLVTVTIEDRSLVGAARSPCTATTTRWWRSTGSSRARSRRTP